MAKIKDPKEAIGKPVHLDWAYAGAVWILDAIEGDMAILRTPKTGKLRKSPLHTLRYTRKQSLFKEQQENLD